MNTAGLSMSEQHAYDAARFAEIVDSAAAED